MISFIKNEHMKIYYKRSNLVLFLTYLSVLFVIALATRKLLDSAGIGENFLGYVSFSTGFLMILPFFVIAIAGSIVSNEYNWGTIKFLLIRPAKRSKILLSKYITVLLFSVYFIVVFFLVSVLLGFLLFGFEGVNQDSRVLSEILMSYLICAIEVIMISTLAFSISTIFRNSALATGISILLLLTGKTFVQVLAHFDFQWGRYVLFANTNLGQYVDGRPLFEGSSLGFSIVMLLMYLMLFLGSAWMVFVRRDVSI
ncbi:ABC transporter permease [Metabacillus herbersteinensis]|uniref:ABC transporter permease n=1 Tax=Metabacillus herbersteinensis TaxID=283816 RepID=A0ABV6GL47_9BACI